MDAPPAEPTVLFWIDGDWQKRTAWAADTLARLRNLGVVKPIDSFRFLAAVRRAVEGGGNCPCPDSTTHTLHVGGIAEELIAALYPERRGGDDG